MVDKVARFSSGGMVGDIVQLVTSASTIGNVGLNAGSNEIGAVVLHTSASTIGMLGAGENLIGTVGGKTTVVSASFAIIAASAAYTAGDTMSASPAAIITLSNCARVAGGTGWIMGGMLIDGANNTTKLDSELYILSASPAAATDNAPLAWTTAEATNVLAVMPFANWYVTNSGAGSAGNCAAVYNMGAPRAFQCATGTQTLYAQLVARNAYSSANGEAFYLKIFLSQD